jgi:CRP-like cAMP-binding protein
VLSGIDELHQFKVFAELDAADFESIARIAHIQEFEPGRKLTAEGAAADQLYLFLKGKAEVKASGPNGGQVLIDEVGPGEVLGWSAVMEPYVYTASAWTTQQSEVVAVSGSGLRELFERNKRIGYQVVKGVGEVISRRFGQTVGGQGIDQLRQFKIFAKLSDGDLQSIARIADVQEIDAAEELTTEGAAADRLYLFLKGKAQVKATGLEGGQALIDEVGPGELLGWSTVVRPYVYTASSWTTEPSEVIVVDGRGLRELFEANERLGYHVVNGIGEVISKRFGQTIGLHGIDELHQFKIFAELDVADLDSIARIADIREFQIGEELTVDGAAADRLYLFLKGKAEVKVSCPGGSQALIDEVGPGEILGWSAVIEPYIYTASSWTTQPSEAIVISSNRLRDLFEANKHIGYQVVKGVGEVISRRFGQAIGSCGDLREKDLRAFSGEERVVWERGEVQLTTQAVLIGMGSDGPDVIPLDSIYDVEVQSGCVVFHAHSGDVCSPFLEDPEHLAALVHDEMRRTRYARRRKDYYLGSN